ncbi:hypothetical protein PACTADRAFT_75985 [Pachysolen tannophilus NRRL Y-2460]|uniref:Post-GPI attachment to proteins factor 3 n=1 Tax=Pachysolen tannophilus NRRL Y-2460 TaxID=669874 RepID=A0A1E4TUQ4_PACTA|nr:hypothetical protein PACTADRAFT_75985 [Pachysolen tannophilus NRRL Y-2460]
MKLVEKTLFLILVLLRLSSASPGDELDEFQDCVKKCDVLTCGNTMNSRFTRNEVKLFQKQQEAYKLFDEMPLPLHLTLVGWDCLSNCDYQCQRIVTKKRKIDNEEIYQFHGKWPFIRVFGIQEFFSTAFSIGNFIPHYLGYKKMKFLYLKNERQDSDFKNLYFCNLLVSIITMTAWVFSTLFHLKDTNAREKLDYFFAAATVLTAFYALCVRVFKLYLSQNNNKRKVFTIFCISLYVYHVRRLLLDWSYTYNMQANVFVGILQYFLWIYLSISTFKKMVDKRNNLHSYVEYLNFINMKEYNWTLTPILLILCVAFGMSFELFDFPPILDLLDAHAIWHFITIFPGFYWYDYMCKDIETLREKKFY